MRSPLSPSLTLAQQHRGWGGVGGRCMYHREVSPLPVSDTGPAAQGRG